MRLDLWSGAAPNLLFLRQHHGLPFLETCLTAITGHAIFGKKNGDRDEGSDEAKG